MVICLERGADLHMAYLMPLPLTVSCFSKIQIDFTFLVPAHLCSPGKRAVKRVCVCDSITMSLHVSVVILLMLEISCHVMFQVLSGKDKDTQIPDSNVGSQLLKKMGWTGGGVGKDDNKGIVEPVSLAAVVNRAGLGSTRLTDFQPSVKRVIDEFIRSDGHDDLVFSPEFTKEERAVIHAEAHKRHLRTRSYGSGDQRHLILSLQRTPLQLVEHLRAHGGQTVKYFLIEPQCT